MLECCILFAHYRDDPITRDHLDRLRRLNPYPVVALCNAAPECVDGALDVARLTDEWADEDPWAGADTILYRWYRHGGVRARRYVFLEWDTLATMPVREFYAEVWDADAACSEVKRIEADPNWWFHQRDLLPEPLRRLADPVREAASPRFRCQSRDFTRAGLDSVRGCLYSPSNRSRIFTP